VRLAQKDLVDRRSRLCLSFDGYCYPLLSQPCPRLPRHRHRSLLLPCHANEPITVIIGKTFESTTLPDGSQQTVEVTKYKRLNDGHIYTKSKLRQSADDDKENLSVQNSVVPRMPGVCHKPTKGVGS
jgi:hypothetical protein